MSERERTWGLRWRRTKNLTGKAGQWGAKQCDIDPRRGGTGPIRTQVTKTKTLKDKPLTFLAFSKYILYLSSIAFISSSFFWRAASSSLIFCTVIEKKMKHDQFKILPPHIKKLYFLKTDNENLEEKHFISSL